MPTVGPSVGAAAAQEAGLSFGRGWSGFEELGRPVGVSAHVQFPFAVEFLHVAAAYRVRWDRGDRPGTTCDRYWPFGDGCREEPIRHESRLVQWEVGGGITTPTTDRWTVTGTLYTVWNRLSGGSWGEETGRWAGAYYPDGHARSLALVAGASYRIWPERPFVVVGQARTETLDFQGLVTDMGVPFAGTEVLTTFELGVAVRPR